MLAATFTRMVLVGRRRGRLDHVSFKQWLGRGTTPRLDAGFWRLMLTSVLNATAEQVSANYALMYFLEGLMQNRLAWPLGVPRVPLEELHHDAVLAKLGPRVRLRTQCRVRPTPAGPRVWIGDEPVDAAAVVLAVRWAQLPRVVPPRVARGLAGPALERLRGEAIIGVHLWFDQPLDAPPVLGLLGQDLDWVLSFDGGRRLSLVASAAASWRGLSAAAMKDRALVALRQIWPELGQPARWAACREGEATFIPAPGLEALRPGAATRWPGLFLAGAWTATGWPATQEGAVRSGYAAAGAILGRPVGVADLPRQGLCRL
jgi:hypothetical protein